MRLDSPAAEAFKDADYGHQTVVHLYLDPWRI